MNRAVIVSPPDYTAELIQQTLRSLGYDNISAFSAGNEARRYIQHHLSDIVIISAPISGEFGTELAEASAESDRAVILLCSSDIADELADRLSPYNILVLSKPISREKLSDAICLLKADVIPFSNVRESEEVMRRICNIRLVSRAKSMLMKYLGFTEPQAHRYIEKQAMNCRCTRCEAAKKIISDLT